jgi:hypothetical protein
MTHQRRDGWSSKGLSISIVLLSILIILIRSDLWPWVLAISVTAVFMLRRQKNATGPDMQEGRASAINEAHILEDEKADDGSVATARLGALEAVLAKAELFAYELKHGLVPDGDSERNPGYGPMDFREWLEWKEREFERTGNIWHNYPNGLPPQIAEAASGLARDGS